MEKRILIVEDEEAISKMIAMNLRVAGMEPVVFGNGLEAERSLPDDHAYDLALLDVMVPGRNGFELLEAIKPYDIPILFLTAKDDLASKLTGLTAGAEDYIVKPFEALELIARIEVVLRRSKKMDDILSHGDITVDTQRHTVTKGGVSVSLTPKEFDVLTFFMRHKDIAVSRSTLLTAVWGYGFEGETRTVDMHVQQIRKKLDLHDEIVTIPKLGYRLESR